MDTFKTISQTFNDVDQTEPIFYGILIFAFVSLFLILFCIFCCFQHNQLEDYSFISDINQRLINDNRCLLNYPKTGDKISNKLMISPTELPIKATNKDQFKQISVKSQIYEPSIKQINLNKSSTDHRITNLSNLVNRSPTSNDTQINSKQILTSQQSLKKIDQNSNNNLKRLNLFQQKDNQTNFQKPKILNMITQIKDQPVYYLDEKPKIVKHQTEPNTQKVNTKLVAEYRLKMLKRLKSKNDQNEK